MAPASRLIDGILSALLPAYRDNLAKASLPVQNETSSSAATTTTIPADIVGTWTGRFRRTAGTFPSDSRSNDGSIAAALGKQPPVTLTNIRATAERVAGRMTADLGVEYAGQKPYEVRFSLEGR